MSSRNTRQLPIFPLSTVLFPGATLPLRIFEPRYKEMLRACMDGDRRFGVALIKKGEEVGGYAEPYSVGTVARIEDIGSPSSGTLPIVAMGESRFRIITLDRSKPYLTATVEVINEDLQPYTSDDILVAAMDATKTYIANLLASQGAWHAGIEVPEDPFPLSYFMGIIAASAPERSRQRLLESDTAGERLQAGIALLEEESDRLRETIMRSGPGEVESRFSSN